MLVELLCGTAPFSSEDEDTNETKRLIQEANPKIPQSVSKSSCWETFSNFHLFQKIVGDARDLALKLLVKDPTNRLGSKNGAADLKKHKFFEGVNWDKMMIKMYRPPILLQLQLSSDDDTHMFSADFTTKKLLDQIQETAMEDAEKFFNGKKKNFLVEIKSFISIC